MRNNGPHTRSRAESIKSTGAGFDCESKSEYDGNGSPALSSKSSNGAYNHDERKSKKKTTGPLHNMKYKAKLCKNWSKNGFCQYYEKCQFAHGQAELEKWTRHRTKYQADLAAGVDSPQFGESKCSSTPDVHGHSNHRHSIGSNKSRAGSPPVNAPRAYAGSPPPVHRGSATVVESKLPTGGPALSPSATCETVKGDDMSCNRQRAPSSNNNEYENDDDCVAAERSDDVETTTHVYKESAFKSIGGPSNLGLGSMQMKTVVPSNQSNTIATVSIQKPTPQTQQRLQQAGQLSSTIGQTGPHRSVIGEFSPTYAQVRPVLQHNPQLGHDPQRAFQPLQHPVSSHSQSISPVSSSWSPVPVSPSPLDVESTYSVMDQLFDSPTGFSLSMIRSAIFSETDEATFRHRDLKTPQFEPVRMNLPPRPQSSAANIIGAGMKSPGRKNVDL